MWILININMWLIQEFLHPTHFFYVQNALPTFFTSRTPPSTGIGGGSAVYALVFCALGLQPNLIILYLTRFCLYIQLTLR
jgi:hypothetical protein